MTVTDAPVPAESGMVSGMGFALSDDSRMILQHVRDFCRAEIAPHAAEYDRSGEFPHQQLRGLAEMGLLGATVPEEWGGAALDSVTYALCLEEISAADASVGVIVSVQNGLPEQMILRYGSDVQREKYLKPLASGERIGAFCLTEASAGSDAASLRLKASATATTGCWTVPKPGLPVAVRPRRTSSWPVLAVPARAA